MRFFSVCCLRAALVACAVALSGVAQAGMIGLNLTGFQIRYTTAAGRLDDLQSQLGGNLDPSEAVTLSGTEFTFDDTLVAQYAQSAGENTQADLLLSNISPDLFLPSSVASPSVAQSTNNTSFGLDWFYEDGAITRSLQLKLDRASIVLLANPLNNLRPTLVVTGSTANWTQANLPGGLAFTPGTPISFAYTTTNTMPFDVTGDEFVSLLASGGVMEISGEGTQGVPEPASVALLLVGAAGVAVVARRRPAVSRQTIA